VPNSDEVWISWGRRGDGESGWGGRRTRWEHGAIDDVEAVADGGREEDIFAAGDNGRVAVRSELDAEARGLEAANREQVDTEAGDVDGIREEEWAAGGVNGEVSFLGRWEDDTAADTDSRAEAGPDVAESRAIVNHVVGRTRVEDESIAGNGWVERSRMEGIGENGGDVNRVRRWDGGRAARWGDGSGAAGGRGGDGNNLLARLAERSKDEAVRRDVGAVRSMEGALEAGTTSGPRRPWRARRSWRRRRAWRRRGNKGMVGSGPGPVVLRTRPVLVERGRDVGDRYRVSSLAETMSEGWAGRESGEDEAGVHKLLGEFAVARERADEVVPRAVDAFEPGPGVGIDRGRGVIGLVGCQGNRGAEGLKDDPKRLIIGVFPVADVAEDSGSVNVVRGRGSGTRAAARGVTRDLADKEGRVAISLPTRERVW
jgi:hypothetical protein